MNTVRLARAMMAVLQPLTGTRSTGTATVSSTGGTVTLCRGEYAAPIIASDTGNKQIARDKLVMVGNNPATQDREGTLKGSWDVTPGGTAVTVHSHLGGGHLNFPVTTELRWDPELTGIEKVSSLATAMTGGVDATGDAHVKRVLFYEELTSAQIAAQLFAAKHFSLAPTLILAWSSSPPSEKKNRKSVWLQRDNWAVFVVVERSDGTIERGHEGLNLADLVCRYLGDRGAVDGRNFSDPPLAILGRSRLRSGSSSYVYAVSVQSAQAFKRIDLRTKGTPGATFPPWETTRIDGHVAGPPDYPLIDDARYDHE